MVVAPDTFGELLEPHRRALHLHCYRMLGSLEEAEDAGARNGGCRGG